MRIVHLAGSPAANSRTGYLLDLAAARFSQAGAVVDAISVRDLPAQSLLHADAAHPRIIDAIERIARSNAVIIATPVYKAAYSGILKAFLDLLPQSALDGKVVLPIATGGSPAHMLAVDYALRPVLSALGARYILSTVYVVDAFLRREGDTYSLASEAASRVDDAFSHLLDGLNWSKHLRRAVEPAAISSTTVLLPDGARCSA